jgi:hypothetical protein
MSEASPKTAFLAVLIYEDGNAWRCEEPRVYHVTHPEIAYQLALADGNEQRYGRRFLGLSHLEETTEEVEPITHSQKGDARELVVDKDALVVFSDPRWKGVPFDQAELENALREPPLLFEIEGLEKIPWHNYTHAYGTASDVPKDIRRLASSESEVREGALWQLSGSIYHQGTIYSATAVAVPFLLQLALDRRLPDRPELCELLDEVAKSAAADPAKLREKWAFLGKNFGEVFAKPTAEMAEDELANFLAVRQAFLDRLGALQELQSDSDPEVAKVAASIVRHLERAGKAT